MSSSFLPFVWRTAQTTKKIEMNPKEVRFFWDDAPICNLFSGDDVPVSPFRMGLE